MTTRRLDAALKLFIYYISSIVFAALVMWLIYSDTWATAFTWAFFGASIATPIVNIKDVRILLGRRPRKSRGELNHLRRMAGLEGRGKITLGDGASINGSVEGADIYVTGDDVTINGEKVGKGKYNKRDLTRNPLEE